MKDRKYYYIVTVAVRLSSTVQIVVHAFYKCKKIIKLSDVDKN
jgi:hypothetical protein